MRTPRRPAPANAPTTPTGPPTTAVTPIKPLIVIAEPAAADPALSLICPPEVNPSIGAFASTSPSAYF